MVFSSTIFIFYFLPFALAIYFGLHRAPQRWRNFALAALGYVFYGWADPRFILLMFATTFVDWLLSLVIAFDTWKVWTVFRQPVTELPRAAPRSARQRRAIVISVVSNLAMLGFFKYFNFGVDSFHGVMEALGLAHGKWDTAFRVVLPLGISFYTFQSLSYIIDVYRGDARAMRNFVDFSCFVSMFPHLVAGPILKFSFLADQLEHRTHTLQKFARGSAFFTLGLAKKILLANACGKVADEAFNAASVGMLDAWAGVIAYAFQIYFDFSGYSDMAIGLGLMFGFVFARNFDLPYRAESITEFWHRWHISLSTWLREYLYIPLGGNRLGPGRTYLNLMLTMLLGGLWHGASWNFVIWGGIHGGMLAFERSLGKSSPYRGLPRPARIALTFLVVCIAWVFFRASDLPAALQYLAAMFGLGSPHAGAALIGGLIYQPYYVGTLLLAGGVVWFCPDTWEFTCRINRCKVALCTGLGWAALVMMLTQSYNPFIYFIF
jgi:alginate O-acetyltransferase complex protein AlgI